MILSGCALLFENERIRVSDFRLSPGARGGTGSHPYPTIRWQVGDGCHILEHNGADSSIPAVVDDKSVLWIDAGDPFQCFNSHSSAEYRQICWEIKQPPRHTEDEVRAMLDGAIYSTEVGTTLLFENRFCRVWVCLCI